MEPTPLRFTTSDVVIAADRRGDPRDPPVFFLHGGGQTRHSWGTAAEVVAERGWCTYTLDSRGHGESDWSAEANYSLQDFAGDLISIAEVVRDLHRADTQPEQSYSERQLYESALDRMAREVAAANRIDKDAAVELLSKSLSAKKAAAPVAADADAEEAEAA